MFMKKNNGNKEVYSSEEFYISEELPELTTRDSESTGTESMNFFVCDRFKPLWGDELAYR